MFMMSELPGSPQVVSEDLAKGTGELLRSRLEQREVYREDDCAKASEYDGDGRELYPGPLHEVAGVRVLVRFRADPRALVGIEDAPDPLRRLIHFFAKVLRLACVPTLKAE